MSDHLRSDDGDPWIAEGIETAWRDLQMDGGLRVDVGALKMFLASVRLKIVRSAPAPEAKDDAGVVEAMEAAMYECEFRGKFSRRHFATVAASVARQHFDRERDALKAERDEITTDLANARTAHTIAQASITSLVERAQTAEQCLDVARAWLDFQSAENANSLYGALHRYFKRPYVSPGED
jgi:hypothetical protein